MNDSMTLLSDDPVVVSIIGRPNVGKSTLFNRLIGRRRAITDPTPGVTRDLLPERWYLAGNPVTLVDSGGVKMDGQNLDEMVSAKSLSLLKRSDAIIFMMDCTEVTAEDLHLLEALRPYGDRMVLTVNKVDDPKREDLVWEFYGYGYERVVGISAAHGLGIDDLEELLLGMLDFEEIEQTEEEEATVKLAIMGKPNTGKSTLANLLVGRQISLVSEIAGTTRDVVSGSFVHKGTTFNVLDTAGIRRKSRVDEDIEYYSVNRAIRTIEEADVVFLVVDSAEGLADQDKKIAQLIVRRGKGVVIVLNKIDLLSGVPNELEAIRDRIRFLFPVLNFAPVMMISALEEKGIEPLLDTAWSLYRQLHRRIETSHLNEALRRWGEEYPPPRGREGHFKVYYGTQVSTNPVNFLLFVNRMKEFPASYLTYLTNKIRSELGFPQIPVEIDLKERRRSPSLNLKGPKPIQDREEKREVVPPGRTGGKAVARKKRVKPGNKAAVEKARRRAIKEQQQRKGGK
ncbi:MAG: ribosome biogenesis GTPase Der [Sphaerochaeta sp.]|jgi:GTP-binding protein|nr:MAG: ribosome biogenesis GTPase Der [Sphaerochaeta sp.]